MATRLATTNLRHSIQKLRKETSQVMDLAALILQLNHVNAEISSCGYKAFESPANATIFVCIYADTWLVNATKTRGPVRVLTWLWLIGLVIFCQHGFPSVYLGFRFLSKDWSECSPAIFARVAAPLCKRESPNTPIRCLIV